MVQARAAQRSSDELPYRITFSDLPDGIRLDAAGVRNIQDSIDLMQRGVREARSRDVWNILCVFDLQGAHSLTQIYKFAANFEDFGLSRRHRIAIVDVNAESYDSNEFASIVATNRGLNARTFPDVDTALAWLCPAGAAPQDEPQD